VNIGINGLGRIGKLLLWKQCDSDAFDRIVVNVGRQVGQSLHDLAAYIEHDSTYGNISSFLHGHKGGRVISEVDDTTGTMRVNGKAVTILRSTRNPGNIAWDTNNVRLVVDTTGVFKDPTEDGDCASGSCQGHVMAGADKVIISAPFKIKAKGTQVPDNAVTLVAGINDSDYIPRRHTYISAASCTTTCLAYMMKPMLEAIGADKFLSASMVTVHAATGSQQVLDRLPGPGARDRRKTRSVFNNIILTSTGAANALAQVIPEMRSIGFIAESVRVPTSSGSLIVLVLNLEERPDKPLRRKFIQQVYREYSERNPHLVYTEEQNVSSDIVGMPATAAVIEASEIHTRTGCITVHPEHSAREGLQIPVTQVVVYGWYDNEQASYVNMLMERIRRVAEEM
jgi:glyceraldehyde 3-phosphate dehydrogenase